MTAWPLNSIKIRAHLRPLLLAGWGVLLAWLLAWAGPALAQAPTVFTYQGRLRFGSDYVNGTCSFQFLLFDAATGGSQVGPTLSQSSVSVTDGYFTVDLDFGAVFSGPARYLQINQVNCGRSGDPVDLAGRAALNRAPSAATAATAGNVAGVDWNVISGLPEGFADGEDNGLTLTCADNKTLAWVGGTWGGWDCSDVLNDHGRLGGLADDDHPQYLLINGARPMAGNFNMNGQQIVTMAPATTTGQAVTYDQTVRVNRAAGGSLGGVYPNPTLVNLQGRLVAATLPVTGQVLAWDGNQWLPNAAMAGGPASGDLSSSYPNPTVIQLRNRPVANTAPQDKQALRWNSATGQWEPGDVVYNGQSPDATSDLTGSYPNPSVTGLQGRDVSSTAPNTNQVLTWSGTQWEPRDPQPGGAAGGDLSGTYPNPTVVKMRSYNVSANAPDTTNNVLIWNGSWTPSKVTHLQGQLIAATPPTADYQVLQWNGSNWVGGTVIVNGTSAGGDLTGAYPNPTLANEVAGMPEVSLPMGYGEGRVDFTAFTSDRWILPSTASFTPTVEGKCLVLVSAYITSTGSANSGNRPYLMTARKVGSTNQNDGSSHMYFSSKDVNSSSRFADTSSANYVWDITSAHLNNQVTFGCYIRDDDATDWGTDETATCRVSFVCM